MCTYNLTIGVISEVRANEVINCIYVLYVTRPPDSR